MTRIPLHSQKNQTKYIYRAYPEVFFALSHHAILRLCLDEPFPHLLVANSEIFTNKAFGKTRTLVIKAVVDLVIVFDLEMRASSGASLLVRWNHTLRYQHKFGWSIMICYEFQWTNTSPAMAIFELTLVDFMFRYTNYNSLSKLNNFITTNCCGSFWYNYPCNAEISTNSSSFNSIFFIRFRLTLSTNICIKNMVSSIALSCKES